MLYEVITLDQSHAGLQGRLVVRAHEHVALDGVFGIRQVDAADVVKGSYDRHLRAEQRLRFERGRLTVGHAHSYNFV